MDTSREIKEDSSFNMTLLILVIGLVGIGGALLFNNIPLFGMIIALPLLCITCILLLKYPWFILFVIFTINYFILGITRYIPIEGISVIMDILYVTALVLLSIHAALYQNIEWKRAPPLKSCAVYGWDIVSLKSLTPPEYLRLGYYQED